MSDFRPREKDPYRLYVSDVWAILNGRLTPEQFFKPDPILFHQAINMWNGRWKHEQIQSLLHSYTHEKKKVYEYKNWVLVGKVDAINEDHILEIKTSDNLMHTAKPWHVDQAKCYNVMFNRPTCYIVQPVTKDNRLVLKKLRGVRRNDSWFKDTLEQLDSFHKQCLKIKETGLK